MNDRPIKYMLMGIALILIGGFLLVDPSSNLGGVEVILLVLGLVFNIAGLMTRE